MSSIRKIAVETKGIGERDSLEPKLIELSEKLDYFNHFVWMIIFWHHFLRWDHLLRQWGRQRKEIIWNTLCVKCVSGRLSGAEKKGPGFWKLFIYTYFTQWREWVRLNKRKKTSEEKSKRNGLWKEKGRVCKKIIFLSDEIFDHIHFDH